MISVGSADGRWTAWRWRYFPAVLRVVVLRTRESREDSQVSVTRAELPTRTRWLFDSTAMTRTGIRAHHTSPWRWCLTVLPAALGIPGGKRTRNSWQGVLNRRATLSLICDFWGKRSCDGVCARLKGGDRQSLS
jgi:hypothetical protein